MEFSELSQTIVDRFPRLSPQLRLAARFVLDRPDDVALKSMRAVAADAGVHPSTMTRLVRALEIDSYEKFRTAFQHRLRSHPADYLGRAQEMQARAGSKRRIVVDEVLEAAVGNLKESFSANSYQRFAACAEVLGEAGRLFVAGRRSCFPIGFYFHYVYGVFRNNSVLMDGYGGTFADRMRGFGEGDVLFAISFDPYSAKTVQAVEFARESGGKSVVLTDNMVSPLVDDPEHTLIIRNESPSFFQSVAPAMAAVEALVALIVLNDGKEALSAIRRSENQLRHFDAYWNQAPDRWIELGELSP